MDWELYERYQVDRCFWRDCCLFPPFFLAFQKSSSVQHLRAFLVRFTLPPQRFLGAMEPSIASCADDRRRLGCFRGRRFRADGQCRREKF